jgi:hypothetical protein
MHLALSVGLVDGLVDVVYWRLRLMVRTFFSTNRLSSARVSLRPIAYSSILISRRQTAYLG